MLATQRNAAAAMLSAHSHLIKVEEPLFLDKSVPGQICSWTNLFLDNEGVGQDSRL